MAFDMHFLSCTEELRVDTKDLSNNYIRIPLIWLQDSAFLHVYPFSLSLSQWQGFIVTSFNFFLLECCDVEESCEYIE